MCGIVGSVNWGNINVVRRMADVQAYRGPDDSGVWQTASSGGDWAGLGSRRLSILDLSAAGHMPMISDDGNLTIVYNGEIYNHLELRPELIARGYKFRSTSDTETLLNLYHAFGADCLRRLNGMFAFAIWDNRRQELFLARDHFGIKPLYYAQRNSRFAFASELKSLLELPEFERRLDLRALNQYLTFLWIPEPATMFEGVSKLPAGHYAVFRQGELKIEQYWDLKFPAAEHQFKANENELTTELRERFIAAVKSQLLSDVPLGSFLSAGLDSTSIVAAMHATGAEGIRTYTITFPSKYRRGELTLDDTDVAKRTAQRYGCNHTEILVEPDVLNLLPKLVWHMDDPTADPAIITAYLVNAEASSAVKVMLSGVGGDEVFAGYRKHIAHNLAQVYQRIPSALRRHIVEPFARSLPSMRDTSLKGYVRFIKKMTRSGSLPARERFIMDSTYLTEEHKNEIYNSSIKNQVANHDSWERHRDYFKETETADFLNQMLYLDTKAFMGSLNLNYNDKMSMASSVEVRVPFLDKNLVEWVALNVPPNLKLHHGTTKHIFREAMRPLVPSEVLQQKKAGFGAPADYWLANDLREMVDDLLSESRIKERGLFNPSAVRRIIEEQRTGREDWSLQIWQFLTLELWMQTFLDKSANATETMEMEHATAL